MKEASLELAEELEAVQYDSRLTVPGDDLRPGEWAVTPTFSTLPWKMQHGAGG